jgi:FkbM family methyltransferase
VFVDVGANTGFYTVLAAKAVGSEGHVYAIEPAPPTAGLLRRNVALNDVADRVTVVEAAAGSESGVATLYGRPEGHDMTSSLVRRADQAASAVTETEVPVRPIAEFLEPEHRAAVRLVKIDVEGHEDAAIRGLDPLFAAGVRPTILVEVHQNVNPDAPGAIVDFAARHGLSGAVLADDQGELAPRDRRLSLHELGGPPVLEALDADRYNLVLRPG